MHLTLDSESDGHIQRARRARTELPGLRGGGVDGGQHWQALFQTNTHTHTYINVHTDGKNISGNNAIFIYEDKKKKKKVERATMSTGLEGEMRSNKLMSWHAHSCGS